MAGCITLDEIKENIVFFRKMYDAVRLVDPMKKQVLEYYGQIPDAIMTTESCYHYWNRGEVCDNCISMRAEKNQKSYIKLEYMPGIIIMVTAIPIQTNGDSAVLELIKNVTEDMMFGSAEHNINITLCNMLCEANNRLIRDPLTSLYNRLYIDERLPVDIINAIVTDTPLSVVFMDIDNFKEINDTHGHLAGDSVLKTVSNILQGSIRRKDDWVARYGGDEFLICMGNTPYEGAHSVCERIRRNITDNDIDIGNMKNIKVRLSVSLGVYTMQGINLTAEELISRADRQMYIDKRSHKASL